MAMQSQNALNIRTVLFVGENKKVRTLTQPSPVKRLHQNNKKIAVTTYDEMPEVVELFLI